MTMHTIFQACVGVKDERADAERDTAETVSRHRILGRERGRQGKKYVFPTGSATVNASKIGKPYRLIPY